MSGAEFRRTMRSARVVVLLLLYSLFSLLVLLVVGSVATAVRAQVAQKIADTGADADTAAQFYTQARQGVLGILFSNDAATVQAMRQVPLVVLFVFKVTLVFLPAYVALMGFDQLSGDVSSRSIRYLVVRAKRSSILFGKFVAQALVLLALVLAVDLGIFLYARVTNEDFATGLMLATLGRFWVASIVFSLAYLGLTAFCSASTRQPAMSLILNFVLLLAFWLIDVVGGAHGPRPNPVPEAGPEDVPSAIGLMRYLSPAHYANDLIHPQLSHFGVSVLAYLAFACVFLTASWGLLRTRDL